MAHSNPINLVIISTISCRWNEKIFEKKNKLLIDLLLESKIIYNGNNVVVLKAFDPKLSQNLQLEKWPV